MSAEESRQSIPFEPAGNKKQRKSAGKKGTPVVKPPTPEPAMAEKGAGYIPEVVSKRMIRRALVFCGVPVLLGMSDFILGYFAIINHWYPVSNTVVLLTSMACLGLSVLGLSYGILSACWEEDSNIKGSVLGWTECKTNFGRMVQAYRATQRVRAKIDPNL
jgi:Photosynthesis affected mutant 68